MKNMLVIDAHAMAYRAYYALAGQNLTNSRGQPTAGIFGFFRMLFKILQDYEPDYTVVAWDPPDKSFRFNLYKEYKANRKPMPDDLRFQIDEIKELLSQCNFPQITADGFEADDVMGTLAERFGKKIKVVLLTGDKDCYQLLGKNVRMLRGTKGVSEFTEIDPDWVASEIGVKVDQIIDYMALIGDSSDNIPGAKGVGPKSALTLIQQYNNIDQIYKNIDTIKPAGLQNKLRESEESVRLSYDLAKIETAIEEVLNQDDSELKTPDYLNDTIIQLFKSEGYQAIFRELQKAKDAKDSARAGNAASSDNRSTEKKQRKGTESEATLVAAGSSPNTAGNSYHLITEISELKKALKDLSAHSFIAIDTETNSTKPSEAKLVGISLSGEEKKAFYISVADGSSLFERKGISLEELCPVLQKFLNKKNIKFIGQNIKYDLLVLKRHGLQATAHFDTMIASYLINPTVRRNSLDDQALDLLAYDTIKYEDIVGKGKNKKTLDEIDPEMVRDYACEDADITLQLFHILKEEIKKNDLTEINEKIEVPLIDVLTDMEYTGVAIDQKYFAGLSADYEKIIKKQEKELHKIAGYEFNVNSTKELQNLLFEKLNLPRGKKTKTGFSTDQSVLEELRGLHPAVDMLLEHRKYSKLKSTYVDALPALIHPETGRIHTSFNQTIAATGRLSSTEPNLQNIPIREQTGRAIRRGFIPAEGCELLALDYSQIELRIMAHYSRDRSLIQAFTEDRDIHAMTAASLFRIEENEVSPDQRSQAKTVNFSIVYGVTEYGLSQSLGIPYEQSRTMIERFFQTYPGIKNYMDETIEYARKHGYVRTLSGRKRPIPDIEASNRFRKEGAERTAINTPIQGTSADIIKLAMIAIHADIMKQKLKSRMILQVHDELIFDVRADEKEKVLAIAQKRMENVIKLSVPLRVDYRFGQNWDQAH